MLVRGSVLWIMCRQGSQPALTALRQSSDAGKAAEHCPFDAIPFCVVLSCFLKAQRAAYQRFTTLLSERTADPFPSRRSLCLMGGIRILVRNKIAFFLDQFQI